MENFNEDDKTTSICHTKCAARAPSLLSSGEGNSRLVIELYELIKNV